MNNIALYFLTVLIWGTTWYAITFQIGVVDPLLSSSYRFAIAAIALLGFLFITKTLNKTKLSRRQHGFIALQGLFLFCLNYWLTYLATIHITSGLVAVVFSTMSLMNVINQRIIFKIEIKKQVILGSIIGLAGIITIFWPELQKNDASGHVLLGIGFCLLGTYLASLGNMASLRNTRDDIPVMHANAYGMGYGAIISFAIAMAKGTPITFDPSVEYIGSLIYLAIMGSAVAFGCYLVLLRNIGADKAAYASVLFPVVALTVSTFFEGYIWTPMALVGMILVILGNIVTMTNRESLLHWRKRKAKEIIPDRQ